MTTKQHNAIAEYLYEIITGLHGYRDDLHTKWEKQAKAQLRRTLCTKNIVLENNKITIQNTRGTKDLYTIIIQ